MQLSKPSLSLSFRTNPVLLIIKRMWRWGTPSCEKHYKPILIHSTGKKQMEKTGKRLKEFGIHFDSFWSSTSVRARESTEIISRYLPNSRVAWSELLREGQPGYPEPGFPANVPQSQRKVVGLVM